MRVAPEKRPEPCGKGVEFEYVRAKGSTIPTFAELNGASMTFPDGRRQPPLKAFRPVFVTIFESVRAEGLNTPTFDPTMMTLPLGASTPPENRDVPGGPKKKEFETVEANGLN
jgi:hypothetical protein